MWHILEKQRVQGYQIGYSQCITRGSYKDRDKDKDKDKNKDKDKDKDKEKDKDKNKDNDGLFILRHKISKKKGKAHQESCENSRKQKRRRITTELTNLKFLY